MKLYELTGSYARLLEAAEEGADVAEQLETLEGDLEAKGAGIAKIIASLDGDCEAARKEGTRLIDRARSLDKQVERLRDYVRQCMESAGITRIKGATFTISLVSGQQKVNVLDESAIPTEHMRVKTTREPNKTSILAAFKEHGEVVPGCEIVETTSLRIR